MLPGMSTKPGEFHPDVLTSLLDVLATFRTPLTRPGFANFLMAFTLSPKRWS